MRRWDREGRDATRQCHLEWSASMSESGPSCRFSKELGSAHFPRVEDFARIELVTPSELLDLAWSYPLLEALLWPPLAAVRPRLRDAGGAVPLQVRAYAGSPE